MATRQIPRSEWAQFLDHFSKTHMGKKATLELYGQGIPTTGEVKALPFEGITYEEKGSDAHAARVMLGDSASDHLAHEVPSLVQVWSRPLSDEDGEMLELHGGDDQRLILKLQE